MFVHFYEIKGCNCANVDNLPVIVAPGETPLPLLTKYQFVQLPDGRWVHFLTTEEYKHVMTGYPEKDVFFEANPYMQETPGTGAYGYSVKPAAPPGDNGKKLALAGWICYAASWLLPITGWIVSSMLVKTAQESESFSQLAIDFVKMLSGLGSFGGLAAFVIMIILRIRYKDNVSGKVLMWIYIISAVLALAGMILLAVTCSSCIGEGLNSCEGCLTECQNCD